MKLRPSPSWIRTARRSEDGSALWGRHGNRKERLYLEQQGELIFSWMVPLLRLGQTQRRACEVMITTLDVREKQAAAPSLLRQPQTNTTQTPPESRNPFTPGEPGRRAYTLIEIHFLKSCFWTFARWCCWRRLMRRESSVSFQGNQESLEFKWVTELRGSLQHVFNHFDSPGFILLQQSGGKNSVGRGFWRSEQEV